MKRLKYFALAFVMMFAVVLTACGGKDDNKKTDTDDNNTAAVTPTAEENWASVNNAFTKLGELETEKIGLDVSLNMAVDIPAMGMEIKNNTVGLEYLVDIENGLLLSAKADLKVPLLTYLLSGPDAAKYANFNAAAYIMGEYYYASITGEDPYIASMEELEQIMSEYMPTETGNDDVTSLAAPAEIDAGADIPSDAEIEAIIAAMKEKMKKYEPTISNLPKSNGLDGYKITVPDIMLSDFSDMAETEFAATDKIGIEVKVWVDADGAVAKIECGITAAVTAPVPLPSGGTQSTQITATIAISAEILTGDDVVVAIPADVEQAIEDRKLADAA